jgi:predicted TIM-barrel fold metal-dependent hydrolase
MIIDFHVHIGDYRNYTTESRAPMTWEELISFMDEHGIDKGVFLPVYNASPEGAPPAMAILDGRMSVHDQVLDAARYPDRIIPCGNMDPRWVRNSPATDFSEILDWFITHGCVGIGEVTANIPFDDPRTINMFQQCGNKGLMVTIESAGMQTGAYGLQDEPGAPRLERLLRAASQTTIIGHGPGFWAEMAADVTAATKSTYIKGPIAQEGAVWRLLRDYPNLYADLSAMSGYNALTRDREAGLRFLDEFQDKLLFATDTCFADAAGYIGHKEYLQGLRHEGVLSQAAHDKIMHGNAERLLGLD